MSVSGNIANLVSNLMENGGLEIVAIDHRGRVIQHWPASIQISENDLVILNAVQLEATLDLISRHWAGYSFSSEDAMLMGYVLPYMTIRRFELREAGTVLTLAIWPPRNAGRGRLFNGDSSSLTVRFE